MDNLKIYMCDPTHDSIVLVSDTMPINLGFIGSYAKKLYGDQINVTLFKYPQTLIDAMKTSPPDVLALSDYSWNSYLSECLSRIAKQINPSVITVKGGTNIPDEASRQPDFLLRRPSTDFHVELEGEIAFSNLVGRVLEARDSGGGLFDKPVGGCVFLQPSTIGSSEPLLMNSVRPPRIQDLDVIPSPYLNGMLDHFFDGKLTPFLETNRGCPFKCSFCHDGKDYFQKINMFSVDRIKEEIAYIAPRVSKHGIVNLHIADVNFGMYPRDRDICMALREAHEEYGWPLQIMSTTGKNNKERVIDITNIMGNVFSVNMSVQSMSDKVLTNIKRGNIKLDDYMKINDHLNRQGRTTKGELILGLPGETRESFLKGVAEVIEANVSSLTIFSLMLLNGTEFQDPEYQAEYEIKGKFRIVPLNFGEYENVRVVDYEEVGIQTKDMSFEDHLYIRGMGLLIEVLHNARPFEEFFRYAMSYGVSRSEFLFRIYDRFEQAPKDVKSIIDDFLGEVRSELWDSPEELIAHYQTDENFGRLVRGEVGTNLTYKYKAKSLALLNGPWVSFLSDVCKQIAKEKLTTQEDLSKAEDQINLLSEFCLNKLSGLLDVDGNIGPINMDCLYDIVGWHHSSEGARLNEFELASPINYEFFYTDDQIRSRSDQFKRYGSDLNAMAKITTRVGNVGSLFRKVGTRDGEQLIVPDAEIDQFTRYSLAG